MSPRISDARKLIPRMTVLLLAESCVAMIVIVVALAWIFPNGRIAMFKAASANVLTAMSARRMDMVEHYALTGEWIGAAPAAKHEAAETWKTEFRDGAIVAEGTVRGYEEFPFRISLRPAVADDASHWAVVWLCGTANTPAGWISPAVPASSGSGARLIVSSCNERPGS